ncbi:MAG: JAB domain-containing protein, partial [Verrucomicrobiota bacterium]
SLVHPREVFKEAIRSSAAAVVLAHNHPSGDPSPSPEDLRITKRLVQAGEIIEISVLDHIILGQQRNNRDADFISLRETGLIDFKLD